MSQVLLRCIAGQARRGESMSTPREELPTARTYIGTECVLKITCAQCARTVPVDLEALAKSKFGDTPLLYLELRCPFCRSREVVQRISRNDRRYS